MSAARLFPTLFAALLLPTAALVPATALAGACAAPGEELLVDPEGDYSGTLALAGAGTGTPEQDLLGVWLHESQAGEGELRLHFTLKVAGSGSRLPPNAAWYSSFQTLSGVIYGVRLQTDELGTPRYFSYVARANSSGGVDGRFVQAGSARPALEGSGPDAEGNIRIVVRAEEVGLEQPGDLLYGFNAATVQSIPGGNVAATVDEAPDGLGRNDAVYKPERAGACSKSQGVFGGAWTLPLLPLLAAALRRRRA